MRRGAASYWMRFFLTSMAIALAVMIVMALAITSSARGTVMRQSRDALLEQARLVAAMVQIQGRPLPGAELDSLVRQLGGSIRARITVLDTNGVVLADSRARREQMENHRFRPEVIAALRETTGCAFRSSRTLGGAMHYVAYLSSGQQRPFLVRTSVAVSDLEVLFGEINRVVLLSAAILIVAILVASLVLTRALVRPLASLTRTAERIAAGDLEARAPIVGAREFGHLARTMNTMTDRIRELLAKSDALRQRFETVISSMREAVVVLDHERRIVLANESFRQLVGTTRELSREPLRIWDVLRNPALQDMVERALLKQEASVCELAIRDRTYRATVVPLSGQDQGLVAVFHDITEYKELERLKADFIANVSHELRTPLTAIKGYAETLLSDAPPEQARFLSIIERNADRLINLVNDLLLITQLERPGPAMESRLVMTELDLAEVVRDAMRVIEAKARAKGIGLKVTVQTDLPRFRGDRHLIDQLLVNLLDNAVKYTVQGEVEVSLKTKGKDLVQIDMTDTGPGIAAEHIPRIFDRFYVVDKNRSRELGGTGLGLAIVKHIVLAHNGSIAVQSSPGKGTTFSIVLPIGQGEPSLGSPGA